MYGVFARLIKNKQTHIFLHRNTHKGEICHLDMIDYKRQSGMNVPHHRKSDTNHESRDTRAYAALFILFPHIAT